eukprot:364020-Chlamydomonas_euryale.AAC.6
MAFCPAAVTHISGRRDGGTRLRTSGRGWHAHEREERRRSTDEDEWAGVACAELRPHTSGVTDGESGKPRSASQDVSQTCRERQM